MKRLVMICIVASFLIMPGAAQSESSNSGVDPGFLPGNPLYTVESAVEEVEVGIAGLIGGPDLKAKAIANNAQERLAESKALADLNRSQMASKAVEKYEKAMNRSFEVAKVRNNSEITGKLKNISRNNVEKLKEIRDKLPEEARKGIDRAIKNSNRNNAMSPGKVNQNNNSNKPESIGKNQNSDSIERGADAERNTSKGSFRNPGNDSIDTGNDSEIEEERKNHSEGNDSDADYDKENLPNKTGNQQPE